MTPEPVRSAESVAFPRYRMAITIWVEQAGYDEGDAYNRACTNLDLRCPSTRFLEGRNHRDVQTLSTKITKTEYVLGTQIDGEDGRG